VPRAPVPAPLTAVQHPAPAGPALSIGRVDVVVENESSAPVYVERASVPEPSRAASTVLERFRLRA
jgi:hypothetical protein